MAYNTIVMKEEFKIDGITTIHHFEYKSDFIFKSEYHDFWTLFYVEDGCFEISHSGKKETLLSLSKNHLYIQAPNEHYSFRSAGDGNAVVFTIGFYCKEENLDLLAGRDFLCKENLQDIILSIAREANLSFTSRVDHSSIYYLERKFDQPFGAEQLIVLSLKSLFIYLMRDYSEKNQVTKPVYHSESLKRDILLFDHITKYYMEHITEHLKIEKICHEFSIGRSHLQRIFRKQTGMSAIEYFCQMRISVAREYIRDHSMSLTETSQALGYTSVHYFSKQFKKITGMTPSEYKISIEFAQKDPLYTQIQKEVDFSENVIPENEKAENDI